MKSKKILKKIDEVERFNPSYETGLTKEQVKRRVEDGLINKTKKSVTKTYWQIIRNDVFSFFNIVLIIIFILLLSAGQYMNIFFMVVLVLNTAVALYQDVRARKASDKLHVMTEQKAFIIRDGEVIETAAENIVLDDVLVLKSGDQIICDGVLLSGEIDTDESLLTGEADYVNKQVGASLMSGTYIVSGKGYMRADKVGNANYVQTLEAQARKTKGRNSQILDTLNKLFKYISVFLLLISAGLLITDIVNGKLTGGYASYAASISAIAGALVGMIPSGLYLLTSSTLAVGVIKLSMKHMAVQELYSIETLSRVDYLCLDKTGTITDGTMEVETVISLSALTESQIGEILFTLVNVTGDENATGKALKNAFKDHNILPYTQGIPFVSETKYSAVMLKSGDTYITGAREFIAPDDENVTQIASQYERQGYRILILSHLSRGLSKGEKVVGAKPVAIVVLLDHIKDDAYEMVRWFTESGVNLKIISGDNALTVSEIAKKCKVPNAENYISMENVSLDEIPKITSKYAIFGRVTPEQKAKIVETLQAEKHVVAMTGDGINDILALKKADCSIAMASGAQATKNIADIISLDNDFSKLPDVVAEGRRVINNLQRTASLFLTKTMFSIVLSIVFLIWTWCNINASYPFKPQNLYLWEMPCIGIAAFFLAFEPCNEKIKSTFVKNILLKALPVGLLQIICVIIYFAIANTGAFGEFSGAGSVGYETAKILSVFTFSIISYFYFLRICYPFSKYRAVLAVAISTLFIGMVLFDWGLFHGGILGIDYSLISTANLPYFFIICGISVLIYIVFLVIIFTLKRKGIIKE